VIYPAASSVHTVLVAVAGGAASLCVDGGSRSCVSGSDCLMSETCVGGFCTSIASGDLILVTDRDTGFTHGLLLHATSAPTSTSCGGVAGLTMTVAGVPSTLPVAGAPTGFPSSFVVGSLAMEARSRGYFVDSTAIDGEPGLVVDKDGLLSGIAADPATEPAAEGIEDLEVALGVDGLNGGAVNGVIASASGGAGDEWVGNNPSLTETWALPAPTGQKLLQIRLTVIGRTWTEIPGQAATRPAVEDRPVATAEDKFRRRPVTTTIAIREWMP
jgi:hypothetical protein